MLTDDRWAGLGILVAVTFLMPASWTAVAREDGGLAFVSADGVTTLRVTTEDASPAMTAAAYGAAREAWLRERLPGYADHQLEPVIVDCQPTYRWAFTASEAGQPLRIVQYCVPLLDGRTVAVLTFRQPPHGKVQPLVFDAIAGSFEGGR